MYEYTYKHYMDTMLLMSPNYIPNHSDSITGGRVGKSTK